MIGLSTAWRAARSGYAVTVVDPAPGHGASWAAAGMLAPIGESHFGEVELTALNLEAATVWPEFARVLEEDGGTPVHLVTEGTLMVGVDAADRRAMDDLMAYRTGLGLTNRSLTTRQCREAEPLLAPGIRGGAELPDDHQVDNRLVVKALLSACRRRGVTFIADEASGVELEGSQVVAVELRAGGRRVARSVVVAAGCHSGQLDGIPDNDLPPVRPVKGLTLRVRAPQHVPALGRTVRGLVHGRTCYLVPRVDGTVVIGATVEEKGFDRTVQAGAVGDLLDDARRLLPSIEEYELVDATTGLRPGSPDNAPIVGETSVAGLVVATGHYRNGILLAPLTAEAVVSVLDGHGQHPSFAGFGPGRFHPARRGTSTATASSPAGRPA